MGASLGPSRVAAPSLPHRGFVVGLLGPGVDVPSQSCVIFPRRCWDRPRRKIESLRCLLFGSVPDELETLFDGARMQRMEALRTLMGSAQSI